MNIETKQNDFQKITHCYSPKLIDDHEILFSTSQRYHSPGKRATPLSIALTVFGDKKVVSPTVAAHSEIANILTVTGMVVQT